MQTDPIKRVLFVAPRHPENSGGSTVISNLTSAFEARGIDARCISIHPGSRPDPQTVTIIRHADLHAGPVLRTGSGTISSLTQIPRWIWKRVDKRIVDYRLRRIISSCDADTAIIFTHVLGKMMLDKTGYKRRPLGPLMFGQHHSQFESLSDEPWLTTAIPEHFRGVDAFIALTEVDAQKFSTLVDAPCYAISNPGPAEPFPLSKYQPIAISLARLSHEKRVPLVVDLFAKASDTDGLRHWRLDIYGDGPESETVRSHIENSGISDRIRLLPPTTITTPLATASINVTASTLEGFGMTLLESALAGVPSIAFECSPGVAEQLDNGRGIMVPRDDHHTFVRELRRLMHSENTVRAMGARARTGATAHTPAEITRRWIDLFNETAASRI
ncbi:glycosyltransferase [Yimella sp. cx-573]|nr:glycosyltransferase [Yimella sp. cx-573]